jgi:hypothetical protein
MNALRLFLRQGVNAPLRLQDGLANFETGDSGKVSGRFRYSASSHDFLLSKSQNTTKNISCRNLQIGLY